MFDFSEFHPLLIRQLKDSGIDSSADLSNPSKCQQFLDELTRFYYSINESTQLRPTTSSPEEKGKAFGDLSAPQQGLDDSHQASPGQPKLLLVEDNHVNQEVAQNMLKMLGFRVMTVDNGEQALEKVQSITFDGILMDCQMPIMDGMKATEIIRSTSNLNQHTKIIALTANATEKDREACLKVGMDDYLSKPFTLEEFRTVLERALGRVIEPNFQTSSSDKTLSTLFDRDILETLVELHVVDEDATGDDHIYLSGFSSFVQTFIEESNRAIAQLNDAIEQKNLDNVTKVLESLLSTSSVCGAIVLKTAVGQLKEKITQNHWDVSDEFIELVRVAKDSQAEMKIYAERVA